MTIQAILSELDHASGPVVKVLRRGETSKVIVLGFKKGMILKEHQTGVSTRLVVIDGHVTYRSATGNEGLHKFDELEIPVRVAHSVEAMEDSICFLLQG